MKIHALLCRPYVKGRDWYDFNWYVARGITPNLVLLKNALMQYGPWQGQNLTVDHVWLIKAMGEKIAEMNWQEAAADVERFLRPIEQSSLKLWSKRFYMSKLGQLDTLLTTVK